MPIRATAQRVDCSLTAPWWSVSIQIKLPNLSCACVSSMISPLLWSRAACFRQRILIAEPTKASPWSLSLSHTHTLSLSCVCICLFNLIKLCLYIIYVYYHYCVLLVVHTQLTMHSIYPLYLCINQNISSPQFTC